jgi:hypothetical protein
VVGDVVPGRDEGVDQRLLQGGAAVVGADRDAQRGSGELGATGPGRPVGGLHSVRSGP